MYAVPYPASCDDNDELYDRLKKHGKRIKALEDVLDGMQTQISNGQSSQPLVLMAKQIQDFGGVLTGVDRRLTELDQRLIADTTGLRQGLEAQKNDFASLDQRIFKDISGLTQGLASLDQRVDANISGLTKGLDGQKADLASLDQRVERVAANINGLTQGLDGQKADLASLDQRVDANISGLKQRLDGQKTDLASMDQRIFADINGVKQGLDGQKTNLVALDERVSMDIYGLKQGLEDRMADLTALDRRVTTDLSDVQQVIGSIGALDQRVLSDIDSLKQSIRGHNTDLAALNQSVDALNTNVAALDGRVFEDIKGFKQSLEDLKNDIGTLDQRFAADINSLQQGIQRVDDLDQRINSLETGVRQNTESRLVEYKRELDHLLDEMNEGISEKVINASAKSNDRISALEQALANHAGSTGGTLQNLEARYGTLIQKATETEDMLSRYTERVGTSMDGIRAETERINAEIGAMTTEMRQTNAKLTEERDALVAEKRSRAKELQGMQRAFVAEMEDKHRVFMKEMEQTQRTLHTKVEQDAFTSPRIEHTETPTTSAPQSRALTPADKAIMRENGNYFLDMVNSRGFSTTTSTISGNEFFGIERLLGFQQFASLTAEEREGYSADELDDNSLISVEFVVGRDCPAQYLRAHPLLATYHMPLQELREGLHRSLAEYLATSVIDGVQVVRRPGQCTGRFFLPAGLLRISSLFLKEKEHSKMSARDKLKRNIAYFVDAFDHNPVVTEPIRREPPKPRYNSIELIMQWTHDEDLDRLITIEDWFCDTKKETPETERYTQDRFLPLPSLRAQVSTLFGDQLANLIEVEEALYGMGKFMIPLNKMRALSNLDLGTTVNKPDYNAAYYASTRRVR